MPNAAAAARQLGLTSMVGTWSATAISNCAPTSRAGGTRSMAASVAFDPTRVPAQVHRPKRLHSQRRSRLLGCTALQTELAELMRSGFGGVRWLLRGRGDPHRDDPGDPEEEEIQAQEHRQARRRPIALDHKPDQVIEDVSGNHQ